MMLESAAATRWGVPVAQVKASNHWVTDTRSGRKLSYGDLAADAAKLPVPAAAELRLKDPKEFRYIGKGKTPIVDGFDITTGKATYAQDVVAPGMLFAVVARAPVYGGTVASYDAAETLKVPGVVKVVEIKPTPIPAAYQPLAGVAVVADSTWAAMKGRNALKIDLERRRQRHVLVGHLSRGPREIRGAGGQGDPRARRCREGDGHGREDAQGRLLRAAPRAGADGATRGDRHREGRPLRGVDLRAESRGRAQRRRQAPRHEARGRDGERDAAGRRFRAQVARPTSRWKRRSARRRPAASP